MNCFENEKTYFTDNTVSIDAEILYVTQTPKEFNYFENKNSYFRQEFSFFWPSITSLKM